MGASETERTGKAESILEGLRAAVAILSRVAIDPTVAPPLEKRVSGCTREFLTLPLPQQPGFDSAMKSLEASLAEVGDAILTADLDVPIGTFRRKLGPATFEPMQLAAYAHLLATRRLDGGPKQERFVVAVTHALCSLSKTHRLVPRPSTEQGAALDHLLEGLEGNASGQAEAIAALEAATKRLQEFKTSEQMFEANFDREVKTLKNGLGETLLDRGVLKALVAFEVEYLSTQLKIPASPHPMSMAPGLRQAPPPPPKRPPLRAAVAASLRPPPPPPPKPAKDPAAATAEPDETARPEEQDILHTLLNEAVEVAGALGESDPLGAEAVALDDGAGKGAAKSDGILSALAEELEDDIPIEVSEREEAADRVEAIADVLSIARELGTEASHVELIERTLSMCKDSLERLGEPDSKGYDERRTSFEDALAVAEDTALEVDSSITMESFRSWFERKKRPRDVLVRYAGLLGGAKRLRDLQRDRLEFVATRLLSHEIEDNRLALSPRSEAAPVLDYIIRNRPKIRDHERSGAVMFFRDATLQLSTLNTLDEVFSGGFYLDVRGYKVALREQLMDPDVLYAAISLNVAIHNRIEEMRELESRSKMSLHNMLGEEEQEVQKAFLKRASMRAEAQFEETRRYLSKYRENIGKGAHRAKLDRTFFVRVVLSLLILAGALFAYKMIDREINELQEVSVRELDELSPLLQSGGYSSGSSERAFIGTVASGRWMLLTPEERRDAAEALCERLRRRQTRAAWISRGDHQAIHIAGGEVVSVE